MNRVPLFGGSDGPRRVLALGAHADDIEIGCGGTLLRLVASSLAGGALGGLLRHAGARPRGARVGRGVPRGRRAATSSCKDFRDGFLPYVGAEVKEAFEALKREFTPDLVFTHHREDRHQDHRLVSELTWNTWRDHLILEYEIPKYDGDLGAPNVFVALPESTVERKIDLVLQHFPSQAGKHWLTARSAPLAGQDPRGGVRGADSRKRSTDAKILI